MIFPFRPSGRDGVNEKDDNDRQHEPEDDRLR
jgi:hypothetical protein